MLVINHLDGRVTIGAFEVKCGHKVQMHAMPRYTFYVDSSVAGTCEKASVLVKRILDQHGALPKQLGHTVQSL